ncbi:superoxide dismutase [Canna indica]|uniref:superoxide dismutase n=1 Tax=Canna indica TaxID=4628 RepID=A0AAQ3QI84_9LILI|nr:superoxide dismutase [Canna indica]
MDIYVKVSGETPPIRGRRGASSSSSPLPLFCRAFSSHRSRHLSAAAFKSPWRSPLAVLFSPQQKPLPLGFSIITQLKPLPLDLSNINLLCSLCSEASRRPLCSKTTKQKKHMHQFGKATKVFAYYGLTSPPYKLDALEPYLSRRTLELHWGGIHRGYVDKLNEQIAKSTLYGCTMEELIKTTFNNGNPLPEYNNAAEIWNHDFFWESMQPNGGKLPPGSLLQQIEKDFGSYSNFRDEFVQSAMKLFGSGWVWLALKTNEKKLTIFRTSNAVCPLVWGDIPIIGLDMWEHAYYLDYKDDVSKYVNDFMDHLISWHSATARMFRAQAFVNLGEPKIPVA